MLAINCCQNKTGAKNLMAVKMQSYNFFTVEVVLRLVLKG
jgi:hypothetical protein